MSYITPQLGLKDRTVSPGKFFELLPSDYKSLAEATPLKVTHATVTVQGKTNGDELVYSSDENFHVSEDGETYTLTCEGDDMFEYMDSMAYMAKDGYRGITVSMSYGNYLQAFPFSNDYETSIATTSICTYNNYVFVTGDDGILHTYNNNKPLDAFTEVFKLPDGTRYVDYMFTMDNVLYLFLRSDDDAYVYGFTESTGLYKITTDYTYHNVTKCHQVTAYNGGALVLVSIMTSGSQTTPFESTELWFLSGDRCSSYAYVRTNGGKVFEPVLKQKDAEPNATMFAVNSLGRVWVAGKGGLVLTMDNNLKETKPSWHSAEHFDSGTSVTSICCNEHTAWVLILLPDGYTRKCRYYKGKTGGDWRMRFSHPYEIPVGPVNEPALVNKQLYVQANDIHYDSINQKLVIAGAARISQYLSTDSYPYAYPYVSTQDVPRDTSGKESNKWTYVFPHASKGKGDPTIRVTYNNTSTRLYKDPERGLWVSGNQRSLYYLPDNSENTDSYIASVRTTALTMEMAAAGKKANSHDSYVGPLVASLLVGVVLFVFLYFMFIYKH